MGPQSIRDWFAQTLSRSVFMFRSAHEMHPGRQIAMRTRLAYGWLGFLPLLLAIPASGQTQVVRFATFNTSLNRCADGQSNPCLAGGLQQAFANPSFEQGQQIAEIIQRVAPDIVLLNEFNFDPEGIAADLFQQNFLSVAQNISRSESPATPLAYPYRYLAPSNTGIASGFDLNNDGQIVTTPGTSAYGDDALGFGEFPGRYGMLLLSRFPIESDQVRTFQRFLWKDMPDALLPDDPRTPEPGDWYTPEELEVFRLSSKSHWDVPITIGDRTIHVLASHPTPPAFDGPEDRNGRRNHDEIRLWADYLTEGAGNYLLDDEGRPGPLPADGSFVIMGDLNADPVKGDSFAGAIDQLLSHPRVDSSQIPATPSGNTDTASFNLRVDYVLPSTDLRLVDTAIFRPPNRDPLARLIRASDHQLVWADLEIANVPEPAGGLLSLCGFAGLLAGARRNLVA